MDLSGRLVHFESEDGLLESGFLIPPTTGKLIVHLHGMGGSFHDKKGFAFYAKSLSQGHGLFVIGTRGSGTLTYFNTGRGRSLLGGTSAERFEDCVLDISGALNAARRAGYGEFVLGGHSGGCQKVVFYQSLRKNKNVKGLVLLAPSDGYNATRMVLKKRFEPAVLMARAMTGIGKGDKLLPAEMFSIMTANRFLSLAEEGSEEAQLFNYETERLRRFSSIKQPVLAVFGSWDQVRTKSTRACVRKLAENAGGRFSFKIIRGAYHGFSGKERLVSGAVSKWLEDL